MIKARGETAEGTPLLLIGLSGENVTRLAAGEPIVFDTSEIGLPPMQVIVMYGRTEQEIATLLGVVNPSAPEPDRTDFYPGQGR